MNLEDERKLKFDRRLQSHQDWINDTEIEAELAQLPDASEKIFDPAEEESVSDAPAGAPAGSTPLS